jgi:hypothetical protein
MMGVTLTLNFYSKKQDPPSGGSGGLDQERTATELILGLRSVEVKINRLVQ